ncbi:ferrous iron transport protein B [Vagococcus zengguangii]|uniref:ferrous iron transport protein B n=1 Tax=Vagococcus zengguangii TaxID=2571750 RepID=UPI0011092336|nr:ferrous iron transport protein B [Vagococcus zengguangii]TLG79637.1 ferrous iron transport protein B [Vagococcus zengguangii]
MTHGEIALTGNPNSGKTSLFNKLTGGNQHVGNWPGVTVEKKTGTLLNTSQTVQDLPGIYSLSPYSPEEIVTRNYLFSEQAKTIINIIDATNLERSLYLTLQLIELGKPIILAINMIDLLADQHLVLDLHTLSTRLNIPVCGISAKRNKGLAQLEKQLLKQPNERPFLEYDQRLETALSEISSIIKHKAAPDKQRLYAIKLFEKEPEIIDRLSLSTSERQEIEEIIDITEQIFNLEHYEIIIQARYQLVDELVKQVLIKTDSKHVAFQHRLDKILTNKWLGLPIFAVIMWSVYYLSIQSIGAIGTDWVNDVLFGELVPKALTSWFANWQVANWLQALILDGIVAGVGAVIGFVPQLCVLFICLNLLEDSGYMARIAFVLDRIFRRFGLSGKSFIPMLVSSGCGVPGIMACRTIESEQERRMTIMTTTFIPCSAKLPVIGLIASAFFPRNSLIAPLAYFIGMGAIILSGLLLQKLNYFKHQKTSFVMELPQYHLPELKSVLKVTWHRTLAFVKNAGSIIFVSSIAIWFLSNYNFALQKVGTDHSILATLGKFIAYLFSPLGFGNWQTTVSTIMGLVAKENIVGTMSILAPQTGIQSLLSPQAALSFLIFNLLCAPCFAAIGAIRREMNQTKWTLMTIGYQCGFAYIVSFCYYQLAQSIANQHLSISTLIAYLIVIVTVYILIKPRKDMTSTAEDTLCGISINYGGE